MSIPPIPLPLRAICWRRRNLGHLRPEGHVEVTGRLKEMIIRKGGLGKLDKQSLRPRFAAV